jgi:hypothetical protein
VTRPEWSCTTRPTARSSTWGAGRALHARDRGCRFPGCGVRRAQGHHIRHWADGGETSIGNLILLCRYHHRLVHEDGFSIGRSAEGEITVRHPGGWLIPDVPRLRASHPSRLVERNRGAGAVIDHETSLKGLGERMDFALCVDAVHAAVEKGGSA